MNINLKPGEVISQNKMEILKLAAENGQLNLELNLMECKADYIGRATVFHTSDIQYLVGYVSKDYVCLQQVATYPCPDGLQICKHYCAVNNGFGCIEVEPNEIQEYAYVIVPDMCIGLL